MTALEAAELGVATSKQRALLFSQNDKINRARLNGWILDGPYQAAQKDYAALNRSFAENAARGEDAHFRQQDSKPGKKSTASPGTDSDYIIEVKSPEQVKRIQDSYNRRINAFLAEHDVAARSDGWHNRLDTDFMADPSHVSQADFEQIAKLNNDAYRRREAAQYEAISRAENPGKISPEQFRAYGEEMRDFVAKKQHLLAELRDNPQLMRTNPDKAAEFHRLMAQEQKYIDRVEGAAALLRRQEGLPADESYRPRYAVGKDANGNPVLTKVVYDADGTVIENRLPANALRDENGKPIIGSLAKQGSERSPENYRNTAIASATAGHSTDRALSSLAEGVALAAAKDPEFRATAARDIAALAEKMPPAAKGALIDRVRRASGDAMAQDVASAMRKRMFAEGTVSDASGAKSMDDRIKDRLGISGELDPRASGLRRSFNEQASKALGALEALGRVKGLYDTAMLTATVLTEMQKLVDPSLTPEERKKVEEGLKSTWWDLVKSEAFSRVLAQSPTVAAMFGTWTLAYDGTGFLLENTETGQRLGAALVDVTDRHVRHAGEAMDDLREYFGKETQRSRQAQQDQELLDRYLREIRSGHLRLREGHKAVEIAEAIQKAELQRIRSDLVVEASAAQRARLARELAAREQAARLQQAARAAADADCGRKKATLSGFNPSTGSYRCICPQGMVVGVGDICVSQRDLAVSNCAKQNADLQSLDAVTGQTVCVCRSGMVYNLAKSACITQEARRAEDAGLCKAQIPNSVFAGYDQGRTRCNCPQGWVWNGADKKSCVAVSVQLSATCPAGTFPMSGRCFTKRDLAADICMKRNMVLRGIDAATGRIKCNWAGCSEEFRRGWNRDHPNDLLPACTKRQLAYSVCAVRKSWLKSFDAATGRYECIPLGQDSLPPAPPSLSSANAAAPKPPPENPLYVDRRRGCDSTSRSAPAGSNPNLGC